MYFNITDGIRDRYSWEVRNLINLYKSSFRDIRDGILDYSIDDLQAMHRDLFKRNTEGFENIFDPIKIIKKVKPGTILSDDNKPNWVGPRGRQINETTLILIRPLRNGELLEDVFEEIRKNKNSKNIKLLIKFHLFLKLFILSVMEMGG